MKILTSTLTVHYFIMKSEMVCTIDISFTYQHRIARGRRGRVVVGFITTYAISAFQN
jgi:hypothetical protein